MKIWAPYKWIFLRCSLAGKKPAGLLPAHERRRDTNRDPPLVDCALYTERREWKEALSQTFLPLTERLIRKNEKLRKEEIDVFSEELSRILHEKYVNHWYPETPAKGQAYRCIRVNRFHGTDPDLMKACQISGLMYEDLGLPREITLWVDPWEVCCRYGEHNHPFTVACFESEEDNVADVSQKVSRAMDNVTSDYHSASSSDDEVYISHRKTSPVLVAANFQDFNPFLIGNDKPLSAQEPKLMLQPLPFMNKYPKKKTGSPYTHQPHFLSNYQPQGRSHKVYGQIPWFPPVLSDERNRWTNVHYLAAGNQCLV